MMDEIHVGAGMRLDWTQLPQTLRADLEAMIGGEVTSATSQAGGFSPGVASRIRLGDGRRLFVKVAGESLNPVTPRLFRQEAEIAAQLPVAVPTPRLLDVYDHSGWVALVFEDIDGRTPDLPWREHQLQLVIDATTELATTLTPTPLELGRLPDDGPSFAGFSELATAKASGVELDDLDPWTLRNLESLAALHDNWATATAGETMLHLDLRADNILIRGETVMFVDWPHATIGAEWIDLLFLLPSVALQGGPQPWDIFDSSQLGRTADPDAVTIALAGLAGMGTAYGRRPDPPGLPTLRRFQRAWADVCRVWLRHRTGWS